MNEPKGSSQEVTRREHVTDIVAKRVVETDPFGGLVTKGNFAKKTEIITVGAVTTIYKGFAQIGTLTSVAEWQISKTVVDETTNTVVSVTWADSTDDFVNEWDERAGYTYA